MNRLKKLKQNPLGLHTARPMYRSSKKTSLKKSKIRQRKKRNERVTKEGKIGKKIEMVAPLQLEQILLKSQKAKKEAMQQLGP